MWALGTRQESCTSNNPNLQRLREMWALRTRRESLPRGKEMQAEVEVLMPWARATETVATTAKTWRQRWRRNAHENRHSWAHGPSTIPRLVWRFFSSPWVPLVSARSFHRRTPCVEIFLSPMGATRERTVLPPSHAWRFFSPCGSEWIGPWYKAIHGLPNAHFGRTGELSSFHGRLGLKAIPRQYTGFQTSPKDSFSII